MTKRICALALALIMLLGLILAVLPAAVPAAAAEAPGPVAIKVHYQREDNNYSGWDVYTWGAVTTGGVALAEENGEMVATIYANANTASIGFIVRKGGDSWTTKDPDGDRFVEKVYTDLSLVTAGTLHVYCVSGKSEFTVVEGDDVVKAEGGDAPTDEASYYVAGQGGLCGSEWNCGDPANKMTLGTNGLYTITYKAVPAGTYEFKVTDGTWANCWGNNGNNYVFENTAEQNVIITFNAETKDIAVKFAPAVTYIVAGVEGLCGSGWNPGDTANEMVLGDDGLYTKTYISVPAGYYEFKVTDGSWANCWGDGGNNYVFETTAEQNITIIFNPETKEITLSMIAIEPYYVAGTDGLCGVGWDPGYAENKMFLDADGLYKKLFKDVQAGSHECKITGGDWSNNWGVGGPNGANYAFTTEEAHNVTITFNPETLEIGHILSAATPADPVGPTEPVEYDITINVHYHRPDNNYSGWEVHMWNGVESLSSTRKFADELVEHDGKQWAVATYYADASDVWIGFIVKTPSWTKDPDGDRKIDISDVTGGVVNVYAVTGSSLNDFVTDKSQATLGAKVTAAVYEHKTSTIVVTTSYPIENPTIDTFKLEGPDGQMTISKIEVIDDYNYKVTYEGLIDEMNVYTIYFNDVPCVVTIPNVYSTEEFEAEFTYTGDDLGATYAPNATAFRLWAPTAAAASVNLYATGSDGEAGAAKLGTYEMTKDVNGTWIVTVEGDLKNVYYTYSVTRKGETVEACDPYARTTGVNGDRAMIVDLDSTDPAGWENDTYVTVGSYTDAVIWELHVRDFSIDESSGMVNKGKYLAFTELGTTNGNGQPTGVSYMVDLGVNYVHLLPVYDINSVDETVGGYNWGYDPKNYNVPEGSYSTNPYDGNVRVTEFKQMVQSLHNNGIGVVMDVVYNHVADAGSFSFNQIVPGYFSRIHDDGSYQSNSGCGNDTASERAMVRKYIVDSVLYWAEEYHIDGFRWDLVGLIDYETINEVMAEVHAVNPNIIFYGEGWEMCTWTTKDGYVGKMTIQNNAHMVNGSAGTFAFFNDTIRNAIHGGVFDHTAQGFISGAPIDDGMNTILTESYLGASHWGNANTVCPTPVQTINYASCHDNYTLIDNITLDTPDATREQHVAMNKLAAAYYITAQGVPFVHAGEEMLRSKPDANAETGFNHNSYASGDAINSIKWNTLAEDDVWNTREYYKGLIAFRKAHPALRMTNSTEIAKNVLPMDTGDNQVLAFNILGGNGETAKGIFVIFNAKTESTKVTLPQGKWEIHVNGEKAGTTALATVQGNVTVEATSAMMLVKVAEPTPDSPSTGDNFQITLWISLITVSAIGAAALVLNRKKWAA